MRTDPAKASHARALSPRGRPGTEGRIRPPAAIIRCRPGARWWLFAQAVGLAGSPALGMRSDRATPWSAARAGASCRRLAAGAPVPTPGIARPSSVAASGTRCAARCAWTGWPGEPGMAGHGPSRHAGRRLGGATPGTGSSSGAALTDGRQASDCRRSRCSRGRDHRLIRPLGLAQALPGGPVGARWDRLARPCRLPAQADRVRGWRTRLCGP